MAFRITCFETFQFFYLCCWFSKTATTISLKGVSFFIRALAFKEWRGLHFYSSILRVPAWVQSIFHIDFNEVRGWNWKMRGRMKISTCLLLCWCAKDHLQAAVTPSYYLCFSLLRKIFLLQYEHFIWPTETKRKFQTC